MNNCKIKIGFFNPSQHSSDLSFAINKIYRELKQSTKAENKKFSTLDFYNELIKYLKSENTPYKVEYSTDFKDSEKQLYKESIINLQTTILRSIPNAYKKDIKISTLSRFLEEQMPQDFNASKLRSLNTTSYEKFDIERVNVEEESNIPKNIPFRRYLNDTYGNCFGAINRMKNKFTRDIFTYSIVDFEKGRYITNSVELNENIAKYKDTLFKTIVNFLQQINPSVQYSDNMYLTSLNVSNNYDIIMSEMENYIKNIDSKTIINEDYAKILSGTDNLELEAINAFSSLKYFDSLLQDSLGKTISFSSQYKNQEVGISVYKYKFKKDTEHQRKSWSDSENRSAAQNTARFSKFVLESIPLYIDGKVQDRNVGIMQFNVTLTKLFSNISYLGNIDNQDVKLLINYINQFHNSPILFAYKIHKLISENKGLQSILKTNIGFTSMDIGTIQSIYKYLLCYDNNLVELKNWDKVQHKSIRAIEFNTLRRGFNLGKYSILNDLVGVMNDCMDATYFYTRYNFNGSIETTKREKFRTRRGEARFRNSINSANMFYPQNLRELLQKSCSVTFPIKNSTQTAVVQIPLNISDDMNTLEFIIKSNNILGVLAQTNISGDPTKKNVAHILPGSKPEILQRVYTLFSKESPIDISNIQEHKKLLAEDKESLKNLSNDQKLFKAILQFIDQRLGTKFLTEDGLQKLNIYSTIQGDNYIEDLLFYATKSQIVSDIYYDFENAIKTSSDIKSRKDFQKFLRKKYSAFSSLTPEQRSTYFQKINGVDMLLTIPGSPIWVQQYDYATLVLQGSIASSVSKNQSGNNDANYVTAYLGGQIHNLTYNAKVASQNREQLRKTDSSIPQVASSTLLFTKHPLLIKQTVINSDVSNRNGDVKSIRDLKQSELFYNAIIHNFWISFINTGEYCIQPTTYSDKVKLIQYLVDGKNYKHFNGKSLSQLTPEEIINYYAETIGESSKLAEQDIIYTYKKLWGEELTLDQINSRLKNYTEDQLIQEAFSKGINLQLDFHYRTKKSGGRNFLSINEVIPYQAKYANKNVLKAKLEVEKINFINNLIDSGVQFYTEYHDTSLYDNGFNNLDLKQQLKASNSPVAKIILAYYEDKELKELYNFMNEWVQGGKLIFAYDKDGNAITYKNTTSVSRLNPLLEKFFYLDSLLSNNLRFQLTGFETNHPDKSKFAKMWDNIAKGIGTKNQLLSSVKNIEKLQKAQIIWGHPALGKTTYLTAYPDSIIDWDNEFNPTRNQFIAETLGDSSQEAKQAFLRETYNYIRGSQEYNPNMIRAYETYKQMIINTWEATKEKAAKNNKKIFASPTVLLELFGNDFDLVLTMDPATFSRRKPGGEDWKQSIDALLSRPDLAQKTINVGNLYMSDIMALNDSFDLYQLSKSRNEDARKLANNLTEIVQNISQGTQLKRNVIVPATMHYMHGDFINGVSKTIKVAVIKDVPAKVFNFDGKKDVIDSMDGSAFITAFQSILENKTLGSQEVGGDKKPIWHHYDQNSATAALMKFASFEINNARMKASMGSTIPLHRMFKKMTNLPWANLDDNGQIISWNTSHPITLGYTTKLTSTRRVPTQLDFANEILEGNPLYYKTYDIKGIVHYKQILDFGKDDNGYYTKELYVDEQGDQDWLMNEEPEIVYHYFNKNSEHHTTKEVGDHDINSLYELWQVMGGMDSQEVKDGFMQDSESSNFAVVGFMNATLFPKPGTTDRMDITQNSYDQPLKDMMIGYLTNNSAMKNGAVNRNSEEKWHNEDSLTYMTMDSRNLGIQMDADHDVEEAATMTEFSQVIAALEAGGNLHKYSKQVYSDLGRVAMISSSVELDTLAEYLAGEENNYSEVKSQLYDLIGRSLLNGIKSREDQANLTDDILRQIEKKFNKNIDHFSDDLKLPLSDPNIYSQIIPTIANIINKKSIKRKFSGSGCVIIPGYNIMQYYVINGIRYMYNDMVRLASEWMQENSYIIPDNIVDRQKYMVDTYLEALDKNTEILSNTDEFIPTEIVDVILNNGETITINLDGLDEYYNFKDNNWNIFGIDSNTIIGFKHNIKRPKNLAPARITFELNDGKKMNVFDLDVFREAYKNNSIANTEKVQEAFKLLKQGFAIINGQKVRIYNLKNIPAELIVSNIYSKVFGTGSKSVAQIMEEGPKAFLKQYIPQPPSTNYDLIFDGTNPTYITFTSPYNKIGNKYTPYKQSELYSEKDELGNINVYLLSDDNRKQFKVGRYIIRSQYSYKDGQYYDEKDNVIPSNQTTNFKREGSVVYEYVEFVSKYSVTEKGPSRDSGTFKTNTYDKYYINIHNLNNVFNRDNSEISKKQYTSFIVGLLDDIYSTKQFEGISFNSNLSQNSAGNIVKFVSKMKNIDSDFKEDVLNPISNYLRTKLKEFSDQNVYDGTITIGDNVKDYYSTYYNKLSIQKYNSWRQSLYFTAARIPAQTLQSFMQMEAIAYTGTTLNQAYVSHWQTWLQGSKLIKIN